MAVMEPRRTLLYALLLSVWGESKAFTLTDVIPEEYDHLQPPKNLSGPLTVSISIKKISIRSIDAEDMSFSVVLELWQNWRDHRLDFPPSTAGDLHVLDSTWIDRLWNPKLYFMNSVDGKLDNIITPSSFFWLSRQGNIYYCSRVILKLICEMNLKYFPHDTQRCGIQMASAVYSNKDVNLTWSTWRKHPEVTSLQQFQITEMRNAQFLVPWGSSANLTCLELQVLLHRQTGYYIINVYIPTILIVAMSMLTFWIPVEAVPARVTLGVTSLLTIITKQYQASMPNVSYIVALNVWLSCCIAFVFFSLLEFATVIALNSNNSVQVESLESYPLQSALPMVVLRSNGTWMINTRAQNRKDISTKSKVKRTLSKKIDLISRICFPASFVIFSVIYWWYYN